MESLAAARFPTLPVRKEQEVFESLERNGAKPVEEPSDDILMSHIDAGHSDALGLLFSRYARLVWTIGKRILRNNEEADDLLQDVFLLVRRRASAFDASKGSVRSLLVQMCYQRAFSRRRDLARRSFYSSNNDLKNANVSNGSPLTPSYDECLEALVGKAALKNAFEALSAEQRETLRLCFFEGYTLEEIAVQLGMSYGNIRHHYYRGLAKLRKRLTRP